MFFAELINRMVLLMRGTYGTSDVPLDIMLRRGKNENTSNKQMIINKRMINFEH